MTACYLHGEQHFTYHRQVCVGDVLEGRLRTSKPIAREARRGPMEVTYFQTTWTDLDGRPVVDERIVSLFFPNSYADWRREIQPVGIDPGERLEPDRLKACAHDPELAPGSYFTPLAITT